jgi:integrase
MSVFITDKHLNASDKRQTYSDNKQLGFALRTTPNGVFTFYYQYLNKKTGKRDWHLIGAHPEWTPARARTEATRLAGLVAGEKDIKQIRHQKIARDRAEGVSFQQVHDEYIAYCKQPVDRRWGTVPRKETWRDIQYSLKRALDWWHNRVASEITSADVKDLYETYVREKHPAQANMVRGNLRTMFVWAMHDDRKYLAANPCTKQLEDDKAVEKADIEDGRVLTADELRTFWFGVDDPKCPGTRGAKLALKLSLVTLLRTGECVAIEREKITASTVTIPLAVAKGRRSKKARDVVQPLNSLAREILGEVFAGDEGRRYAFPGTSGKNGGHIAQGSLSVLMGSRTTKKNSRMGICEYLGLDDVTPHDLRRTGACILEQLGFSDGVIGRVMTHKTTDKDAAPVTRDHYLVPVQIIARPVDPRVEALNALDDALREIFDLPRDGATCATPAFDRRLNPRRTRVVLEARRRALTITTERTGPNG